MAFDAGELRAFLRLDTSQFTRAIDQVPGEAKKAGSAVEGAMVGAQGATNRMTSSVGLVGKAFSAVGGIFAGAKVVDYVKTSIEAASALNQTIGKSQQIFGSAAASVQKWGEGAVDAVGLSKSAAIDAATNFGNMFTQIGYSADAAAELSKQVVQLSADQGAFNNQPTGAVIEKITAAFRGEYDSLQALIPNINAARVEQEALATTGKTSASQLTAQEKAAATLAIVMQDGAKANGQFARESGSLEVQQQKTTARIEEQQQSLGQKLLPVAQTVMKLFNDVGVPALGAFGDVLGVVGAAVKPVVEALGWIIDRFKDLPEPVQVAVVAMSTAAALHGPLTKLGDGMTGLSGKARGLGNALKGAFLDNPIGVVITALATAFSIFSSSATKAEERQKDLKAAVDATTAALDQNTGAATENNRALIRERLGSRLDDFEKLGVTTKQVTDAMLGNTAEAKNVNRAILDMGRSIISTSNYYSSAQATFDKVGVSVDDLTKAALNQDWSAVTAKFAEYNNNLKAGEAPITGYQGLLDGMGRSIAGVRQSYNDLNGESQNFITAQGSIQLKAKDSGKALDGTGRDFANAKGSMDKYIGGLGDIGPAVDDAITALDRLQGKTAELDGINRAGDQAIREYAKSLRDQATAQRDVAQAADDVAQANADLQEAQAKKVSGDYTAEQKTRDVAAASRDVEAALSRQKDAQDGVAESYADTAEKGEQARAKAVEVAIAASQEALAQGDTATAYEQAKSKADAYVASLTDTLTQTLGSRQAAEDYVKQLKLTPSDIATTVIAHTDQAQEILGKYKEQLAKLDGATASTTIKAIIDISSNNRPMRFNASTGQMEYMRAGGLVEAGRVVQAAAGLFRQSTILPGGANAVHWAEDGIPWEGYVSGAPQVRGRSHQIMGQLAERLNGTYLPPGVTLPASSSATVVDLSPLASRMDILIALLQQPRVTNNNFHGGQGQSTLEQLQEFTAIHGVGPFG